MVFPSERLLSGFHDKPFRSKSISGADSPPKSATRAMRFLLWGTPQNCASKTLQARLHSVPMRHPLFGHPFLGTGIGGASGSMMWIVSSRTAAKSLPLWLEKAPGTFSQTMYLGRTYRPVRPVDLSRSLISFMILIRSMNNPDRSPCKPARFPAMLRSWQGEPPMMQSTAGAS